MTAKPWLWHLLGLFLLTAATACSAQSPNVLHSPADPSTAVRFFFDGGNYFHPPIIFRVVPPTDKRLDTAPVLRPGRTVYITQTEMQKLLEGLLAMGLHWDKSRRTSFEDATRVLPEYGMSIYVLSSRGTVKSGFDTSKICQNLAPLDSAFHTPRALWEFKVFQAEFNCEIPGLDGNAYPDHWPWNLKPKSPNLHH